MDRTGIDPCAAFPEFYSNPIIQALAPLPRWTVSTKEKVPIDMRALLDEGQVHGARYADERCLAPIDEILAKHPDVANHALRVATSADSLVVLDVEKTCPPWIAAKLLALPAHYCEVSMSGRGFHLVMDAPSNLAAFPAAAGKAKVQHPAGWYEVLLDHYVTMTRRPVPERLGSEMAALAQQPPGPLPEGFDPEEEARHLGSIEQVWAHLARDVRSSPTMQIDVEASRPEIPMADTLVSAMLAQPYSKTLKDFHSDHSRYEYGLLGWLYYRLRPMLRATNVQRVHDFTPSDIAWLLYEAATKALPHRPKHDEFRNGMPLLLSQATSLVATRMAEEEG